VAIFQVTNFAFQASIVNGRVEVSGCRILEIGLAGDRLSAQDKQGRGKA
jgi:hypothetical protein